MAVDRVLIEFYAREARLRLHPVRQYGETEGFKIVKEYRDVETAKQSGREGFGEMVNFLFKLIME